MEEKARGSSPSQARVTFTVRGEGPDPLAEDKRACEASKEASTNVPHRAGHAQRVYPLCRASCAVKKILNGQCLV
jgi:hypothetical protein